MKYIDADRLCTKIEKIYKSEIQPWLSGVSPKSVIYEYVLPLIGSLQQEHPEVDLEKLGEIARHLIAVKDHEEDMRLDEGEWLLLERIGYPERFNAIKEE